MLRVSTRLVTRRATMCRFYSNGAGYGGSEGATVNSRGGFSDKEKAVENQWARSHVSMGENASFYHYIHG